MRIRVLFFARLREIFGLSERSIQAEPGTTIEELVMRLRHESEALALNTVPLIYAVNEEFRDGDTVLCENDVLALMTPMSGG